MSRLLRLFHLSDIHFGMEDSHALEWARQCILREQPDAVLITGDLTMRARRSEFAAAIEWIRSLQVPVTIQAGNHDLPYFNLLERFANPYARFGAVQRLLDAEIDLPGLAIISLRTTVRAQPRWPWVDGWITRKALTEACDAIDALAPGTRAIILAHHPLPERSACGRLLTRGGNAAMEALVRRGVLAVLSGHVHDPFDLVRQTASGPLRMIGAGTLSRRTRSTPPSFNDIRVDGKHLQVEVRNLANLATPDLLVPEVPEDAEPPYSRHLSSTAPSATLTIDLKDHARSGEGDVQGHVAAQAQAGDYA